MQPVELSEIERAVAPVLEQESAELVDIQYLREGGRWVLRFFLDKQGGISLDDCAYFSDRLGALLDETNLIAHSYVLEVSSPGVYRVIKKEKDFERFAGQPVKLKTKVPQEGQRNFKGRLLGMTEGKVVLDCGGKAWQFAPDAIVEARLDPEVDV